MPATTATLASVFLASLGIGAPIHYTDGHYARIETVLADLDYLGIHQIRTGAWWHGMQGEWAYDRAVRRGVRFDMVLGATDALKPALAQIAHFAAAHPGSLVAIEGPNEINNFGARYHGMTGAPAAVAFQDDLYAGVAADPVLRGTIVYSYTMNAGASSTSGYDYAAIHPYAVDGRPPRWFLANNIATVPAGKRFVVTETGYPTVPADKDGVDAETQAVYNLDMIFDAAGAGAAAVFLYELLDAYPDPGGHDAGKHFGLFDYDNKPKPIAVALHNLARLIAPGGGRFSPGSLDVALSGAGPPTGTMLLQRAPAVFDLVVWDETPLWNRQTHQAIAPAIRSRTVRFGTVQARVAVFDPLRGTEPVAVYHAVSSVTLALGSHPLVVEASARTMALGNEQ
jgi:hypothetical protein